MIASPLRYPGGKAKLFPFFARLIQENSLFNAHYCEPYAGGAGLAIKLLTCGFVDRISINDIDQSIYAFWTSALRETDKFCKLIEKTPVTIQQWRKERATWRRQDGNDPLALGFATYFLNRTNRSVLLKGQGQLEVTANRVIGD
jgi:DNA adenine methylase